jgi:hypothetical protein
VLSQITNTYALCLDGPRGGEDFECPIQTVQLLFHDHHYRFVGNVNGVALFRYVARG